MASAPKIPLIAYYPLSSSEIQPRLKCVALPHLSNRGRKNTSARSGGRMRLKLAPDSREGKNDICPGKGVEPLSELRLLSTANRKGRQSAPPHW